MQATRYLLVLSFFLACLPAARAEQSTMSGQGQQTVSDEELVTRLNGAAPQSVVEHATIMNMGSDRNMKIVRNLYNG